MAKDQSNSLRNIVVTTDDFINEDDHTLLRPYDNTSLVKEDIDCFAYIFKKNACDKEKIDIKPKMDGCRARTIEEHEEIENKLVAESNRLLLELFRNIQYQKQKHVEQKNKNVKEVQEKVGEISPKIGKEVDGCKTISISEESLIKKISKTFLELADARKHVERAKGQFLFDKIKDLLEAESSNTTDAQVDSSAYYPKIEATAIITNADKSKEMKENISFKDNSNFTRRDHEVIISKYQISDEENSISKHSYIKDETLSKEVRCCEEENERRIMYETHDSIDTKISIADTDKSKERKKDETINGKKSDAKDFTENINGINIENYEKDGKRLNFQLSYIGCETESKKKQSLQEENNKTVSIKTCNGDRHIETIEPMLKREELKPENATVSKCHSKEYLSLNCYATDIETIPTKMYTIHENMETKHIEERKTFESAKNFATQVYEILSAKSYMKNKKNSALVTASINCERIHKEKYGRENNEKVLCSETNKTHENIEIKELEKNCFENLKKNSDKICSLTNVNNNVSDRENSVLNSSYIEYETISEDESNFNKENEIAKPTESYRIYKNTESSEPITNKEKTKELDIVKYYKQNQKSSDLKPSYDDYKLVSHEDEGVDDELIKREKSKEIKDSKSFEDAKQFAREMYETFIRKFHARSKTDSILRSPGSVIKTVSEEKRDILWEANEKVKENKDDHTTGKNKNGINSKDDVATKQQGYFTGNMIINPNREKTVLITSKNDAIWQSITDTNQPTSYSSTGTLPLDDNRSERDISAENSETDSITELINSQNDSTWDSVEDARNPILTFSYSNATALPLEKNGSERDCRAENSENRINTKLINSQNDNNSDNVEDVNNLSVRISYSSAESRSLEESRSGEDTSAETSETDSNSELINSLNDDICENVEDANKPILRSSTSAEISPLEENGSEGGGSAEGSDRYTIESLETCSDSMPTIVFFEEEEQEEPNKKVQGQEQTIQEKSNEQSVADELKVVGSLGTLALEKNEPKLNGSEKIYIESSFSPKPHSSSMSAIMFFGEKEEEQEIKAETKSQEQVIEEITDEKNIVKDNKDYNLQSVFFGCGSRSSTRESIFDSPRKYDIYGDVELEKLDQYYCYDENNSCALQLNDNDCWQSECYHCFVDLQEENKLYRTERSNILPHVTDSFNTFDIKTDAHSLFGKMNEEVILEDLKAATCQSTNECVSVADDTYKDIEELLRISAKVEIDGKVLKEVENVEEYKRPADIDNNEEEYNEQDFDEKFENNVSDYQENPSTEVLDPINEFRSENPLVCHDINCNNISRNGDYTNCFLRSVETLHKEINFPSPHDFIPGKYYKNYNSCPPRDMLTEIGKIKMTKDSQKSKNNEGYSDEEIIDHNKVKTRTYSSSTYSSDTKESMVNNSRKNKQLKIDLQCKDSGYGSTDVGIDTKENEIKSQCPLQQEQPMLTSKFLCINSSHYENGLENVSNADDNAVKKQISENKELSTAVGKGNNSETVEAEMVKSSKVKEKKTRKRTPRGKKWLKIKHRLYSKQDSILECLNYSERTLNNLIKGYQKQLKELKEDSNNNPQFSTDHLSDQSSRVTKSTQNETKILKDFKITKKSTNSINGQSHFHSEPKTTLTTNNNEKFIHRNPNKREEPHSIFMEEMDSTASRLNKQIDQSENGEGLETSTKYPFKNVTFDFKMNTPSQSQLLNLQLKTCGNIFKNISEMIYLSNEIAIDYISLLNTDNMLARINNKQAFIRNSTTSENLQRERSSITKDGIKIENKSSSDSSGPPLIFSNPDSLPQPPEPTTPEENVREKLKFQSPSNLFLPQLPLTGVHSMNSQEDLPTDIFNPCVCPQSPQQKQHQIVLKSYPLLDQHELEHAIRCLELSQECFIELKPYYDEKKCSAEKELLKEAEHQLPASSSDLPVLDTCHQYQLQLPRKNITENKTLEYQLLPTGPTFFETCQNQLDLSLNRNVAVSECKLRRWDIMNKYNMKLLFDSQSCSHRRSSDTKTNEHIANFVQPRQNQCTDVGKELIAREFIFFENEKRKPVKRQSTLEGHLAAKQMKLDGKEQYTEIVKGEYFVKEYPSKNLNKKDYIGPTHFSNELIKNSPEHIV